ESLQILLNEINSSYVNPTEYTKKVSLQTHSIAVEFWEGTQIILSVDIVPAYIYSTNEFSQDTYKVPEVIKEKNHAKRNVMGWDSSNADSWINSDPRGYIKIATDVGLNNDFRKTVKSVKKWKDNLHSQNEFLKLKSFHLEQVVTKIFQQNPDIEIFEALFTFFVDFPNTVLIANQISDRINPDKYIDDYTEDIESDVKDLLIQSRNGLLINLEEVKDSDSIEDIFEPRFRERKSDSEEYLFDYWIPVLLDPKHESFDISACITDKQGSFVRSLMRIGHIDSGRYLKFKNPTLEGCTFKWKVKNDDGCDEPRGEITNNQTLNVPENTKFKGDHYVECYGIYDGVCVAKSRHNIKISSQGGFKIK
ncbi:MAG: hypothetical protein OEX08_00890, partial [Candidatus Nomurabacteria bacterium]|nr:hypothetical protein [Candidatus Nomurabacteria bacterium]